MAQILQVAGEDPPPEGIDWKKQIADSFPQAKKDLIASGFPQEQIDTMPKAQVVAIQSARSYQYIADEMEKWWYVPFHEFTKRADPDFWDMIEKKGSPVGREVMRIGSLLLPAVEACRQAEARHMRDFAAFRVIEAIRMHLAKSDGQLPKSLDEISVVAVPRNPATAKPFSYRLENQTAILELPKSDGINFARIFEITVEK